MKLTRMLATTAMVICLAQGATAQEPANADTVLATVDGVEITLGHVIALTSRLPDQYKSLDNQRLMDGVLDQLVQQAILSKDVDANSKRVKLSVENETRALLATQVLDDIEAAAVTEEAVIAAYEAIVVPREYNANHILVETEEEAKALNVALDGGADFVELAKEKSTGPSGPSGGALGWFPLARMVPEFGQALEKMKAGEVSRPVQTQFGWHIILLNETRDGVKAPLEQARESIEADLRSKAVDAEVKRRKESAKVEMSDVKVDPDLIRKTELLD